MRIFLATLLLCMMAVPAFAIGDEQKELKEFCAKPRKEKKISENKNFKTHTVDEAVTALGPGSHKQSDDTVIWIFENGLFILELSPQRPGVMGSSYDDLRFSARMIGGCKLEQLSEVLKNNKIAVETKEPK